MPLCMGLELSIYIHVHVPFTFVYIFFPSGERPFRCELCDKSFNQKNALQIHLKKHSGEKPHKCEYCDNAFTQKGNLKTHIKRAHHIDMVQSMKIPPTTEQGTAAENSGAENQPNEVLKSGVSLNLEAVSDLF